MTLSLKRQRFAPVVAITAAISCALPAAASAADTYADASRPDNSGNCLTPATACKTIFGVGGALSKSDPGDTTFVADGTYAESVSLDVGKSLVSLDDTDPKPVIDGGGSIAITVDASGAGVISGFRVLSDGATGLMNVQGTVEIADNLLDEDNLVVPGDYATSIGIVNASGVQVHDNVFEDPGASGDQITIGNVASDSVISDNSFSGLTIAVGVNGGAPQITRNQISGMHGGGLFVVGGGVAVLDGTPTIVENTITAAATTSTAGVIVMGSAGLGAPGAILSRNRISGQDSGVFSLDSTAPVTLSNDLIYDNGMGLGAWDTSAPFTEGNVSVTNATIFDNTTDVQLDNTTLTMDSSIVGDPIDLVGGNGDCVISYSRGPANAVANGCDDFDTSADPEFADAASGDFNLLSSSALIDLGNPADPGVGAVDFYGNPRAVQGKACSTVRRDIGAAEYVPASTPVCPPAPQPTADPADPRPPRPAIEERPARLSSDRSPTFDFSNPTAAGFRCRLDRRVWKRCTPPVTFRRVKPGKHRFKVQAISPGGMRSKIRKVVFRVVRGA